MYSFPQLKGFTSFVVERHRIYERRQKGTPGPWTKDPILRDYRFCNVYRELDRVTQWIAQSWRTPHDDDPHLWFAMVVARLINQPDTLAAMGYPVPWNRNAFVQLLATRKAQKQRIFNAAYIVSTNGIAQDKGKYLADLVLTPLWRQRDYYMPMEAESLGHYHTRLMEAQGMGSFMAAQVVADLKYSRAFIHAPDWWTFAASGPGSRRGMNFLMEHDARARWREHEFRDAITELAERVRPIFHTAKLPRMHAQDLQNCLCEYSKYRRTELGTGIPKQKFTPHEE